MQPEQFLAEVAPWAQATQRVYRVPASVTLAQAILESAWGESELATKANALFGIKAPTVPSPHQSGTYTKATWEHVDGRDVTVTATFRAYRSWRESVLDHGLFLTGPRYAAAFKTSTPDEFARAIWAAGYATDPNYPTKLAKLMDTWGLRDYNDTEETAMAYTFHTQYDSPNHGGFGRQITLPAKRAVLHWWGNPSGQNPQGIIAWLCNAASQVSAHAVVWKGNVACLVNYDEPSWANGNTAANTSAITLECDPNDIDGTTPTIVAYLADLVRQGNLVEDFELTGHRDWYATECPGTYYPRLTEIRQAVRDNLAGTTTDTATTDTEDIFMSTESTALLGIIADRLLVVSDALTTGKEGVKFDGDVIARLRSIETKFDALAADTAEPERAEPEPETPAETAPVTGANAIRSACAAIRSEQAAHAAYIESLLSIIESNL